MITDKHGTSWVFFILIVLSLVLAGFLTWNLVMPKQAAKFYEHTLGVEIVQPTKEAVGKATIQFKKTEE